MRESTAREGGLTVEQLRARVALAREAQGLPPTIEEPTVLQHVADLMRSVEQPASKRHRGRARAS